MLETQPNWYTPALTTLGWHIGFWNLLGAVGFTLCGALGFASSNEDCEYGLTWSTFIGSWAFLVSLPTQHILYPSHLCTFARIWTGSRLASPLEKRCKRANTTRGKVAFQQRLVGPLKDPGSSTPGLVTCHGWFDERLGFPLGKSPPNRD